MTRERFAEMAARADAYAREQPQRYERNVRLFAALGYTFIFGSIALCAALLVGIGWSMTQGWFWETVGQNATVIVFGGDFALGLAVTLFSWCGHWWSRCRRRPVDG